jgi:eukaryotic-like serine/threonine-protein kinase
MTQNVLAIPEIQLPSSELEGCDMNLLSQVELISMTSHIRLEKAIWQGKKVLIKRLSTSVLNHKTILERFEREADVLERLDHPNIPPIIHRERGVLMRQYIEGHTLYHYLHKSTIDVQSTIHIARALLSALVYSHTQEILHLDIKPSNILLSVDRNVHLIDFGCAKDLTLNNITNEETRLGTPHYMAPEQFKGIRDDPRSDLYSVGAVMYECLMGNPPHKDPFTWLIGKGSLPTVMPNHKKLAKIIFKAIQRRPEHRYKKAADMLEAIEAIED